MLPAERWLHCENDTTQIGTLEKRGPTKIAVKTGITGRLHRRGGMGRWTVVHRLTVRRLPSWPRQSQ